jgi:hypothetical protein
LTTLFLSLLSLSISISISKTQRKTKTKEQSEPRFFEFLIVLVNFSCCFEFSDFFYIPYGFTFLGSQTVKNRYGVGSTNKPFGLFVEPNHKNHPPAASTTSSAKW